MKFGSFFGFGKRPSSSREDGGRTSQKRRYLGILLINTVLFSSVYFWLNSIDFWPVFFIYAVLLTGCGLWYVIYNRGFSRQRVTPEMLPADWTEEQRQQFFAQRDERFQKSKWILTVIFPLLVAFMLDELYLFFKNWL